MSTEPFMPIVEPNPDGEIIVTWRVLDNYRRQIAERDQKIADLILERDALIAKLRAEDPRND